MRVIELRGEAMILVAESVESLRSVATMQNSNFSAIRMTGKAIVDGIPDGAGVAIIWERGAFNFPAGLVRELRAGKHK
jgi:hypothetical protein